MKAPLADRAWVLQEGVLSPQTIYYGSEFLFWGCIEGAAFECEPRFLRHLANVSTGSVEAVFNCVSNFSETEGKNKVTNLLSTWHTLLRTYTSAKLAVQSDRWLAIVGLATKLAGAVGASIVAGLWKEALLDELPWYTYEPGTRVLNGSPIWSWLSLDVPIEWRGVEINEVAINLVTLPPKCSSGLSWTLIKKDTAVPPDVDTLPKRHPLLLRGRLREFHIQPSSVSSGDYPIVNSMLETEVSSTLRTSFCKWI